MEFETVFDEYKFKQILHNTSVDVPIEAEGGIADGKPLVARILKCICNPVVGNKEISGNTLTVDGTAYISVLYATDSGKLCSYMTNVGFTKNIELEGASDDAAAFVTASCDKITAGAVNARKINISGSVTLCVAVYGCNNVKLLTSADSDVLQLKTENLSFTACRKIACKNVIIEEDLRLDEDEPVVCFLRQSVVPTVTETRIISGKVMAKGDISVKIFCLDKDSNIREYSANLPFSQLIDTDGITEKCDVFATPNLCSAEFNPRTGSDGSFSGVIFSAKLCLTVSCSENVTVKYAEDAFSQTGDTEIKSERVQYLLNTGRIRDDFSVSKDFEFSDGSLETVRDLWCETSRCFPQINEGKLSVSGTLKVCILGTDSSGSIVYHERPVDFEYELNIDEKSKGMATDVRIDIVSCGYTYLDSNLLNVKADIRVTGNTSIIGNVTAITDVSVSECECTDKNSVSIYIYFAIAGESLWNIAKCYKTPVERIMESNSIDTDVLNEDTKLIIPV